MDRPIVERLTQEERQAITVMSHFMDVATDGLGSHQIESYISAFAKAVVRGQEDLEGRPLRNFHRVLTTIEKICTDADLR